MDTRKTTPNLRVLEKYAVRVGGGYNHRMGLYDAVLIKDNHLKLRKENIADVVKEARGSVPASMKVEVEAKDFSEVKDALGGKPDIIMLDNMSVGEVRENVEFVHKSGCSVLLEVSGGITLENVLEYAETGVDIISVGGLTHSVKSLDINMEVE
jgi:nicotinate-nucleotide pyrophosphorylase (carboxylating)